MSDAPLFYVWQGDGFTPLPRFQKAADKQFVIGQQYRLEVSEERSTASHNHYFAAVTEAWKNLPHGSEDQFPTPEHLRKYALVKAGYCDTTTVVLSSRDNALRVAAICRRLDAYAIVIAIHNTVTVHTAKSQSHRSMNRAEFQASKSAVLEIVAAMVGTTPALIEQNAGAST